MTNAKCPMSKEIPIIKAHDGCAEGRTAQTICSCRPVKSGYLTREKYRPLWLISRMKLFYTGPVVNAEMLVMMLEKHGIAATQEFVEPGPGREDDLNRPAKVLVPEADYERAHQLFYAEREDEL